jgi:hypothetical protein
VIDEGKHGSDSHDRPVRSGTGPDVARQPTGDQAVDDVLRQLDQVTHEPLDTQIEVSERVQRVLQGRLADLGGE